MAELPPIPALPPELLSLFRWLTLLKQRSDYLSLNGIIDARTILVGTIPPAVLPTLATIVGNINYSQLPTGAGTWAGSPTLSAGLTITSHLLPTLADTADLGSSTKPFRRGYLSQLNAVLFAKETQTLYGGWLAVTKNAGTFVEAISASATSIDFGMAMTLNSFVLVRGLNAAGVVASEYMKVGAVVDATIYTVTRDLAGSGAQAWSKGSPFAVRGVAGDGWLELNAFDTPRLSVFTQGSAYNNSSEVIRIGHLLGMPNSSSGIGAYMGDASNYLRWDGTTLKVVGADCVIDNSGLTLNSTTLFAAGGAAKFKREGTYGAAGASDVFAMWAEGAGGSYQNIYLENFTHRSGVDTKASAYLRATGWDAGGGNIAATPATVRCQSEPAGLSKITLTANQVVVTNGQVVFPATQNPSADPNTLDDYEEGTWTPTLLFGGAAVGMTYSTRTGTYTKVGRQVTIEFRIVLTAKGSSTGSATLTGVPFAAALFPAAIFDCGTGFAGLTGAPFGAIGTSTIFALQATATGRAPLDDTNFSNTSDLRFALTYQV